jgi:hypothetical protein
VRSAGLRLLVLALLSAMGSLPQRAAAQDAKTGDTQTLTSSEGTESVRVPAAWTVHSVTVHDADSAWQVTPPGAETCNLMLQRRAVSRDEVLGTSAFVWHRPRLAGARFVLRPLPHAIVDVKGPNDAEWKGCFSVRVIRRRAYGVFLQAPKATFDTVLPAFLDAVRSFDSTRSQLPDVPDDWKKIARDGYEYYLHAGANEADVAPLHKYLQQQESGFAKRFGPVPKGGTNPIVVLLVPQLTDAAALGIDATPSDAPASWSVDGQCLVVSSAVKGDLSTNMSLAAAASMCLESQAFGTTMPRWLATGDSALRIFEAGSGRALPQYSESLAKGVPSSLAPLRDLATEDAGKEASFSASAMVYVAFLRTGARPYAEKLLAYMKAIRIGSDPDVACNDFLAAVGAEKMHTDAEAFLASFKPVKAK